MTATATDAAGNVSDCSSRSQLHRGLDRAGGADDHRNQPGLPANNDNPKVSGGAAAGSTVRIYKSANCSGTAAVTGSAAQFATGLTVAVAENATTSLTATATDAAGNVSNCSSALSYTDDSIPPGAPTISSTNPASPANNDSPKVQGTAGNGSPTKVKVYAAANCVGTPTTDTVANFEGAGIAVAVSDNQTTVFSARDTDAAGNDSACSNNLSYTADSIAPAPPTISATSPLVSSQQR